MSMATAFIEDLGRHNIRLAVCGDDLKVDAPKNAIDAVLLSQLKMRKVELIAALQRNDKYSNDSTPDTVLSEIEEIKIRTWLDYIGESDHNIIAEALGQCRESPEHLAYFLKRSREVPAHETQDVTCASCQHFNRIEPHPNLGHCAKGQLEDIAGLWDTDRRSCSQWHSSEHNLGDFTHGQ